jgi:hypothetical protein
LRDFTISWTGIGRSTTLKPKTKTLLYYILTSLFVVFFPPRSHVSQPLLRCLLFLYESLCTVPHPHPVK